MTFSPYLIESDQLHRHLTANDGGPLPVVIDASWYLPNQNRNGHQEYLNAHIPGAIFFDIDAMSDKSSDLPHMLMQPHAFANAMGNLGISNTDTIVVYDGAGIFSAARVWWNMRIMGAQNVRLLNGGLPGWKAAGFDLEDGNVERNPATFNATFDATQVRSIEDIKAAISSGATQILDARAGPRFRGEVAEPRAGLRSGHMPTALNLPFDQLLDDGKLREIKELSALIELSGIDLNKPVITSCGSGVTAAVLTLALLSIGHTDNALYDGSWVDWGAPDGGEVVTG